MQPEQNNLTRTRPRAVRREGRRRKTETRVVERPGAGARMNRPTVVLDFVGITDVGRVRKRNEDSFYLSTKDAICVVADGMGGHRRGDVASQLAVDEVAAITDKRGVGEEGVDVARALADAIQSANSRIFRASMAEREGAEGDAAKKGMGTTVVAAAFVDDGLYLAHVGDSRAYRLRGQQLRQLTEDHSFANDCVAAGLLRKEDIPHFRYKNVITRALGRRPRVDVDLAFHPHEDGDVFLLCSDGLTDFVGDLQLERLMREYGHDLEALCETLVDEANDSGGRDNVTVVLVRIRHRAAEGPEVAAEGEPQTEAQEADEA